MRQRIMIIAQNGRQHQSWYLEGKGSGLILTMDVRPEDFMEPRWGLYLEKAYCNRIKNNPFIQRRLAASHPDYNALYDRRPDFL